MNAMDAREANEASGWTRTDRIAGVVLAVLVLGGLPFLVHPWFDTTTDGSIYIVTARAIVAGEGYTYLGSVFNLRPPGFSALIAPLIALRGADFYALNWLVSSFGAAAVAFLFLYLRPGLGGGLAALTCAVVWLNPGFQRLSTQVMSDVPGLAFLLLCLLIERRAARRPSTGNELLLGVAIAISTLVRSLNLLLLPAILTARLWQRFTRGGEPWPQFAARRLLPLMVVVGFSLLPWNLHRGANVAPPPAYQTFSYSYATGMLHEDSGDPSSRRLGAAEILGRSGDRWQQIASALGSRLQLHVRGKVAEVDDRLTTHAAICLVVLLGVALSLLRNRSAAEIYCVAVLAVLLVFFAFSYRLVLPLFVVGLPLAAGGFRDLLAAATGTRRATAIVGLALLVLLVIDFKPQRGWSQIERRHAARSEYFDSVAAAVGESSAIGTFRQGWVYSAYMDRPVPAFKPALIRLSPGDAVDRMIERYDLDAVVIEEFGDNKDPSPLEPATQEAKRHLREKYGEEQFTGASRIWRVRPDMHRAKG